MRTCPECYTELKQANRQNVEIDFCPQCRGVWLDHGELEKLIERASHVPYQQSYQAPPGYQQGPAPSYGHGHAPHGGHAQQHQQHYPPQQQHGYQQNYGHQQHYGHKSHKKHKHHNPAAEFLDDIFDIFG